MSIFPSGCPWVKSKTRPWLNGVAQDEDGCGPRQRSHLPPCTCLPGDGRSIVLGSSCRIPHSQAHCHSISRSFCLSLSVPLFLLSLFSLVSLSPLPLPIPLTCCSSTSALWWYETLPFPHHKNFLPLNSMMSLLLRKVPQTLRQPGFKSWLYVCQACGIPKLQFPHWFTGDHCCGVLVDFLASLVLKLLDTNWTMLQSSLLSH